MKKISNNVMTHDDGTVLSPNLHDAVLTKCEFFEKKLTLRFSLENKKLVMLSFANVGELNIHFPEDFLVFRFSSFNFHCVSDNYFYFNQALESLNIKNNLDSLKLKYSSDYHLFYFEGGMGGSISFVSNCFIYK